DDRLVLRIAADEFPARPLAGLVGLVEHVRARAIHHSPELGDVEPGEVDRPLSRQRTAATRAAAAAAEAFDGRRDGGGAHSIDAAETLTARVDRFDLGRREARAIAVGVDALEA